MKQNKIHILTIATVVTAGLLITQSAQAQGITGGQYLQMATPLSADGYSGKWNATDVNNTPTGIEIVAPGGSGTFSTLYSPITTPLPNSSIAGDTEAVFDFTFNSATFAPGGVAVIFALGDSLDPNGAEYYNFGYPNLSLGLNTVTVALDAQTETDIAGGAVINGFNLQMDPANITGNYDVTINSITLTGAPVPEPSTFAYSALGTVAIWLFRRRK
jgi:hypothetical protein